MADPRSATPAAKTPYGGTDLPAGHHVPADVANDDLVQSEVRHRFRNLVAVTQSLVNQTLRDGVTMTAARDSLNRRLAAMGGALDLLLHTNWRSNSLPSTIHQALAHPVDFRSRIRCDGPEVEIGSNSVMALTLALHELQTNAIKYGALSCLAGRVDLCWNIVDGPAGKRLWMQWLELDGPVVAPPTRRGFGTQLISQAVQRALGGDVELQYAPTGLTWSLSAPLDRVES